MKDFKYEITFELINTDNNSINPLEIKVANALCQIIDQGKTFIDESYSDKDLKRDLAIIKKHIGSFNLNVEEGE
jgi:hypothetical protein